MLANSKPLDFIQQIQAGLVAKHAWWEMFGERETVTTVATGEDLWRGTATKIPIPAAAGEQLSVLSAHAQDKIDGTGVQIVRIEYLDANGVEQTEDVELEASAAVDTVAEDIMFVNDFYSIQGGSNNEAAAVIKLHKKSAATTIYSMIDVGGNQSLVCKKMVPAGKTLYLHDWHATSIKQDMSIRLRSTDKHGVLIAGVYLFKDVAYMKESALRMCKRVKVPALSIVKVSAWGGTTGGSASASVEGYMVDD